MTIRSISLLLLYLVSKGVLGKTVELGDLDRFYPDANHPFIYDECACLSPNKAFQIPEQDFLAIDQYKKSVASSIWIPLTLKNNSSEPQLYMIKFRYKRIWQAVIYREENQVVKQLGRTGLSIPADQKPQTLGAQSSLLSIASGETVNLMINLRDYHSDLNPGFHLERVSQGSFLSFQDIILLTLYGSLCILVIANLALSIFTKSQKLWLNFLSTCFIFASIASNNGSLYTLLPYEFIAKPWAQYTIISLALISINLSLGSVLLNRKTFLRVPHYGFIGLGIVFALFSVYSHYLTYIFMFDSLIGLNLIFVTICFVMLSNWKDPTIKFYTIAWIGFSVCVSIFLLAIYDIFPRTAITANASNFGVLWYGLLTTGGHINHVRHLRIETEKDLARINTKLETQVASRTEELEKSMAKLKSTQAQLVQHAHAAGMAEVTSITLHNMGNLLNTVNIRVLSLEDNLKKSPSRLFLKRISDHIKEIGKEKILRDSSSINQVVSSVQAISSSLDGEFSNFESMIEEINSKNRTMIESLTAQKNLTTHVRITQEVKLIAVIERVVALVQPSLETCEIDVNININPDIYIKVDQHKLFSSLLNLIQNSIDSLENVDGKRSIQIGALVKTKEIALTITDTGKGFDPELSTKLFRYGFSTKSNGTGFGLHDAFNSISSMGGRLTLESGGEDKGAVATIKLKSAA